MAASIARAARKINANPAAVWYPCGLMDDGGLMNDTGLMHAGGVAMKNAPGNAPWLAGLNPAQRRAVEHTTGPLLVLSGAGTGKTRVLTCRLANLLATGEAAPHNILAVTFTNKAAREMRERVAAMIGEAKAEQLFLGTFHSLAARVLWRHHDIVGLAPRFAILDQDDSLRLVREAMADAGVDTKENPHRVIYDIITRWKDRVLTPDAIQKMDMMDNAEIMAARIYPIYQGKLATLKACDFADLLFHNITIFRKRPDILGQYHDRLTHYLVDEYQDTNTAQYLWLRLLAREPHNIFCVGDDDQSIYSWRGAEVGHMLKFKEHYPNAEIIRLEENYRSTGHILDAASNMIAHNELRLGKTLYTGDDKGEKIRITGFWDARREAEAIAERIASLVRMGEVRYDDIAVLVRASFLYPDFEECFVRLGIPYRVVGAKFYDRVEMRDAIAYLRIIARPTDDLALLRIINTPKRGIGNTTIDAITGHARRQGIPALQAAEELIAGEKLKTAAKKNLGTIVALIKGWQEAAKTMPHPALADMVLAESGYRAHWQNQKTADAPGRVENLETLIGRLDEYDSLDAFLEHIALVMDSENNTDSDGDVTLMTLHKAKGLEFDTVFLAGWEDGIFPSQRTIEEKGGSGLEEERRLAYVGMTRARRRLQISWASSRRVHGNFTRGLPSRFIAELPDEAITEENEQGIGQGGGYGRGYGVSPHTPRHHAMRAEPRGGGEVYYTGDRIHHEKFGPGTIRDADGENLHIAFDHAGEKHILAEYVRLVRRKGEGA